MRLPGNYKDYAAVLIDFSDGNPGAIAVLMTLQESYAKIDPEAIFGPITTVLAFDRLGFYGPKIWIFFEDVCHQKPVNCLLWFRLLGLTQNAEAELKDIIEKIESGKKNPRDLVINYQDLFTQVQAAVPTFNQGEPYNA